MAKHGNLKRKTESLLIELQNNSIKPNYMKAKTDNAQQNSKWSLFSDKDETVNQINECRSGKTGSERRELCKWLKFDHADKWYTHKPESVLEKETHKILWSFEIRMDHRIPTSRPDQVFINKRRRKKPKCPRVDFAVPGDHWVTMKESEKINKYLDFSRDPKKLWKMKNKIRGE